MCAVCLLIYKNKKKETWDDAKKLLGQMDFLDQLVDFQGDQVPEWVLEKLRKDYLSREDFNEKSMQQVSVAATALVIWAHAIDKFAKVKKIVGPKEKKLAEAEKKLFEVTTELKKKQAALQEVRDTVASLQESLVNSQKKGATYKYQQETAQKQLVRAKKLVSGLAAESERWKVTVKLLEDDSANVAGNIIVAAAIISYLGPFTHEYRTTMTDLWVKRAKELGIPVADNFNLERILIEPIQLREWQNLGLPGDQLSTTNGIMIFNCRRWPLIIDPQGQANRWVRNLYKDTKLQVIKLSEPNYPRTLENSVRFGQPVLLENVEESLDPTLEPVLLKQIYQRGMQQLLKMGDQEVPYNPDFKFFITTKMPNPHYLPEICIKVTIINFTVTLAGLEDQLLAEVVKVERPELEEKRGELIVQISEDNRQLAELENKILEQIAQAAGSNILNDDELINTLDASKITSQTVNQRMEQSKVTAEEINTAREKYRGVAKRGSILYFVIADLALIDPMYQYSLEFFIKLFKKRLITAPNPPELQERLKALIEDITKSFYTNICRGLFEKDKLLFSFLITAKIGLSETRALNSKEWNFFLRGPSVESKKQDEPPEYLDVKRYRALQGLEMVHVNFMKITESFKDSSDKLLWKYIVEDDDPVNLDFPKKFQDSLSNFQKILVLNVLRPEKLILMVKKYVSDALGASFTVSPAFDLKEAYEDTSSTTPIIFILSPGADPMNYLKKLAEEKEMDGPKFHPLSLGQGQGPVAKEKILAGRRNGDWVCLQNCHLAASWMDELERLQEGQVESETHPDYRLWLTSMPTNKFPVPVLQSGIKITNEPPKGLKANIRGTLNDISDKEYESSPKPYEYKKLLFALAFFHAVILERRKFGAIGWNIPYEWMNSDFETSHKQLRLYLEDQSAEVPYQTLKVLVAEINYGGRVTDDKDVRLINSLLTKYFSPDVMIEDYKFSPGGEYFAPQPGTLEDAKNYVTGLPAEDDPEVFGLHRNANITFQQKNVREFLDTLLLVSPKTSDGGAAGVSNDDLVAKMAEEIEKRLEGDIEYDKEEGGSMNVFRNQEIVRFNKLVRSMKRTLGDLQKAIKGLVVMSIELEDMYVCFLNKKVPENWTKVAYLSLKPLASWVNDLVARFKFMKEWAKEPQKSYWVPAFFFPQGFMTAVLQTYARKTKIPIDTLLFRTEVRKVKESEITEAPTDGVNIHGLFLDGCRWDANKGLLAESEKGQLFDEVPVIWLEPVQISHYQADDCYKCPLYKTSDRRGVLSTTGHSTNFVLYIDLKSDIDPVHWIRRGVALLCMLND